MFLRLRKSGRKYVLALLLMVFLIWFFINDYYQIQVGLGAINIEDRSEDITNTEYHKITRTGARNVQTEYLSEDVEKELTQGWMKEQLRKTRQFLGLNNSSPDDWFGCKHLGHSYWFSNINTIFTGQYNSFHELHCTSNTSIQFITNNEGLVIFLLCIIQLGKILVKLYKLLEY